MAINTNYTFSYDGYPRVHQVTSIDEEEVNNVIIDFAQQYESIPTQSISDFSDFLLEQFNIIIGNIIENSLSLEKYNQSVEPLRNISRIKTDCDKIIYDRENPSQTENPWPPLN
jgi:hypothetical protein